MRRVTALLGLATLVAAPLTPAAASAITAPAEDRVAANAQLALQATSGLVFAPNEGQWQPDVRFRAAIGGAVLWVTDNTLVYDFSVAADADPVDGASENTAELQPARRGHVVALRFDGGQASRVVGHGERAEHRNYLLGPDPASWATDVPLFDEVLLEGLYDGVDLRLYEDAGLPRYDLVLAPGADLSQVRMQVDGADDIAVAADGTVSMQTSLGTVEQRGLLAYQAEAGGRRQVVASEFELAPDGSLGFSAENVDVTRPLVVDPLIWSTFLGGSTDFDVINDIDVAPNGAVIAAGTTYTQDFPTTRGAYDTTLGAAQNNSDAFVSMLSPDGSRLLYSTYLGGQYDDSAFAIERGTDGSLTIAGDTDSDDFPVTAGAYDVTFNGVGEFFPGADGFITRLSADGRSLVYSTYLGGKNDEFNHVLALSSDGSPIVTGTTYSKDFPTTPGAYDTSFNGGQRDAYVARLASDGSALSYGTFLGGTKIDGGYGLAIGADGTLTVAGFADSTDFPTTSNALDRSQNGQGDIFVARFSADGDLRYSTFLGGSRNDSVTDLVLGTDGSTTVVGDTASKDFPTTAGAYDRSHNRADDAFVARLSPDGRLLTFSTFLGGRTFDIAQAVVLGSDGSIVVSGEAGYSGDYPGFPTTPDAYDRELDGSYDVFVTRLSGSGSTVLYSTFLGGSGWPDEDGPAVALGADGMATVAGSTGSADFPTTPGAYETAAPGVVDGYVTRLDVGLH